LSLADLICYIELSEQRRHLKFARTDCLRGPRHPVHRAFIRTPEQGRLATHPSYCVSAPEIVSSLYLLSGGTSRIDAANSACAAASIGRCLIFVLAGSMPRKLSPFQFRDGLIGLGTNPPPQFGQTLSRTRSTHVAQNVHS
jgi:hypothetical protein